MAKNYAQLSGKTKAAAILTPQKEKAVKGQVKNNEGGYVFKVDDWTRLNRFLILGSEGPTYYQSAEKLTKQNAKAVTRLIESGEGIKVVDTVVEVSDQGRAYKNGPALFVLALCASYTAKKSKAEYATELRRYAFANLNKVARIGTHLFEFVHYADSLRGWGKAFQKAVANWYNEKTADKVAYQVCKYASRRLEGELAWSHRDLLRKTHLRPATAAHDTVFRYVTKGRKAFSDAEWAELKDSKELGYVWAHEEVKSAEKASEVKALVKNYNLAQESIPTEWKKDVTVGRALLENMPITATIRGVGKLTANDVIKPLSKEASIVCDRITNEELIRKGRVHPLQFLIALKTYQSGGGFRGSLNWTPIPQVCDALEEGFYKAFNYVEPTGKNYMLGIDVSGSMGSYRCGGADCLTAAQGAAAMAMTIARTEKNYDMKGFHHGLVDLKIKATDSLETVLKKTGINNWGGTDCSVPMQYAIDNKLDVDVFVVITDNDTHSGKSGHPFQVLERYRKERNKPEAKLIVMAMTPTNFSIANPEDPGMFDVVGFDASVPRVISEFVKGNI